MRNGLVVLQPFAGFRCGTLFVFTDLFVFGRSAGQFAGKRVEHDFHYMHHGGDLIGRQVIQQLLGVFSLLAFMADLSGAARAATPSRNVSIVRSSADC